MAHLAVAVSCLNAMHDAMGRPEIHDVGDQAELAHVRELAVEYDRLYSDVMGWLAANDLTPVPVGLVHALVQLQGAGARLLAVQGGS